MIGVRCSDRRTTRRETERRRGERGHGVGADNGFAAGAGNAHIASTQRGAHASGVAGGDRGVVGSARGLDIGNRIGSGRRGHDHSERSQPQLHRPAITSSGTS